MSGAMLTSSCGGGGDCLGNLLMAFWSDERRAAGSPPHRSTVVHRSDCWPWASPVVSPLALGVWFGSLRRVYARWSG